METDANSSKVMPPPPKETPKKTVIVLPAKLKAKTLFDKVDVKSSN